MTTELQPSRDLPDNGYCVHDEAPLWEGGPPTVSEFPLECPEDGYKTSLMDLGFYDSTEEDAEDAQDEVMTDRMHELADVTEAINQAKALADEILAQMKANQAEAEVTADDALKLVEAKATEIIANAEARAAELITTAMDNADAATEGAANDTSEVTPTLPDPD